MEQVCLHDKPIANLHFWSLFPGLKTVDILRSVQLLKVSLGFFWCFVLISATRNNKYADKYNFQQMCWMAGGQCLEGGSNSLCPFSRSVRESSIFIIVTSLPRTSNIPQTSDNKSLYKYVFESPPFFFFFGICHVGCQFQSYYVYFPRNLQWMPLCLLRYDARLSILIIIISLVHNVVKMLQGSAFIN